MAQVDGDRARSRGRLGAELGQRVGLELDDLGLVDLEDDRAGRPVQPVGAGVEAGGQDDRLPDARARPASAKKSSKNRVRTAMPSANRCMPTGDSPLVEVVRAKSPVASLGEEVDADGAHQRFGERIVDHRVVGTWWPTARAAATIVAVAPTLEARSQVSLSVRAIVHPLAAIDRCYLVYITSYCDVRDST